MTSIAVTASMCASAAEVALLVASFMPVLSLDLGATLRGAATRTAVRILLGTPRIEQPPDVSPFGSVDCASVEQYCGGNLTRAWPAADTVLAK